MGYSLVGVKPKAGKQTIVASHLSFTINGPEKVTTSRSCVLIRWRVKGLSQIHRAPYDCRPPPRSSFLRRSWSHIQRNPDDARYMFKIRSRKAPFNKPHGPRPGAADMHPMKKYIARHPAGVLPVTGGALSILGFTCEVRIVYICSGTYY